MVMINNVVPGPGINVIGSGTGLPWIDMNRPSAGMIRFNNGFEVYDGSSWLRIDGAYPIVELDLGAQAAIRWANGKMAEEERLKELAKTNPALQDALDAVQRAEEQVKIVAALVQE
jgi:hypothetical protein